MEDQKAMAYIASMFFVGLASVLWVAVTFRAGRQVANTGTRPVVATLATDGLITGLSAYFLLFVLMNLFLAIEIYRSGAPQAVAPVIATAVSFKLVEAAATASKNTGYAIFIIPCLSGLSAGVTAVLTSAVLALVYHLRNQAER